MILVLPIQLCINAAKSRKRRPDMYTYIDSESLWSEIACDQLVMLKYGRDRGIAFWNKKKQEHDSFNLSVDKGYRVIKYIR